MHRSGLIVRDDKDRVGSLTLALQAVLRWAGADVRYRTLNAALALSLRTTAVRSKACLGWWSTHGSDAFLIDAARMFGIRLRELHPPEAASGLSEHRPYAQHFEASYKPLILRALENGQPVIAWRGWPDVRESLWGVITHTCEEGIGVMGTVMWSRGKTAPLVSPPVQLYVVEDVQPTQPPEHDLLRESTRRFRDVFQNRAVNSDDVVTGVEALDVWLKRFTEENICPTCGDRGGRCHIQHARFLASRRSSGVHFFRHYRDGANPTVTAILDALLAECKGSNDALATSRDPAAVDVLIKTPEGREALTAGIRAARSFESAIADTINRLADALD